MSILQIEVTPEVLAAIREMILRQAAAARERYRSTGEYSTFEQTPTIHDINQHVRAAVSYASQTLSRSQLPRTFVWCGMTFRLIFPERGDVLIADPKTLEILNIGQPGWVDPSHLQAGDRE